MYSERAKAIRGSIDRAEQARKGELDLKKTALIKAMQSGAVDPHSLHVCVCGERVGFFYRDTVKGIILDTSGVHKRFKNPATEIELIKSKAGF